MGALHKGHKSLLERNVSENDISIISIFVNPTQFGPNEDLDSYPRTLEADIKMCDEVGIDIAFVPSPSEMYGDDEVSLNPPKKMGYILEGYYRPTHFAGVLQVVLKLFNLTQANRAYFGQKDAQQLLIIKRMVKDLCLNIEIVGMPIVRDFDNLALSSRNVYLTSEERKEALKLSKTIFHIESKIKNGDRNIESLKREAGEILRDMDIDYMDFYTENLELAAQAKGSKNEACIFLLVVRIGKVRLLDNLWIDF